MSTIPKCRISPGRVLIVSLLVDAWLVFIGRALTEANYEVTVVTSVETSHGNPDHFDVLKYFLPNPFCRLVDFQDAPAALNSSFDFAVVGLQGTDSPEEKQKLLAVTGATPVRAVTLRRYNTGFASMARMLLKEMRQPVIRRSSRVLVEEYDRASWLLRLLCPVSQMGMLPHQRVICQGLPEGLPDPTERQFLFNFLGSYSGPRIPIVDRLEPLLRLSQGGAQFVTLDGRQAEVMWHADRPSSTRDRPLNGYLDTLTQSFFTLCLPGYTIITHRVLEAIHCGSIPVLSEEMADATLLPLEHGRNCWLVKADAWESTVAALPALNRDRVLEMQAGVKLLARREASLPFLARKWLDYLGLESAK